MPFLLPLIAAFALAGCGFKGPLYMPQAKAAAQKPAAPATAPSIDPAPDRPAPSQSSPPPQ
jgi:predicted small lipoprotein YifL